ncbi:MAG TPA: DUF4266 domain-containing protein [Kofleriaceae bacterium]|nr:DUF4266 domain-containing protein [Kofleriaceae bacterium]
MTSATRTLVIVAAALAARDAYAFPTGLQFDLDPVMNDGAGGIAFNGAPRWTNHACDVCHTNTPGIIGLGLEADHPELFTTGWQGGMQYHLRVQLLNEWADAQNQKAGDNCGEVVTPYLPCDQNGFSLEIDDLTGKPQGKFVPVNDSACVNSGNAPTDVDAYVLMDGTAVIHNGAHFGMISWDLCWTAPPAGAGLLTAYLAVVDGNGGDGTPNFPANTTGDDVAIGALPIPEVGGAAPPPQNGGCDAGGRAGAGAGVVVAIALLVALRRRRARLAALVALATAAGCVHVRPTERETLARRNMKFGPDPIEDELDLHMQEAREGSQGGYGSSGGGCGCN